MPSRRFLFALVLLSGALLVAVRRMRARWQQYNARALAFFQKRIGDEASTAKLDSRIRKTAREAVATLSEAQVAIFPADIDVCLSGGGFKTSYSAGVGVALRALREAFPGRGRVVRWAGTSAGGMMALGCITNDFSRMLVWAFAVLATLKKFPFVHPYPLWLHFWPKLAEDNPVPMPGELNISLTRVKRIFPWPKLENWIVSAFPTQTDLGEALMATGCIPWILHDSWWRTYRGERVIDGGFTRNTPHFAEDGGVSLKRPQLIIRFQRLPGETQHKIIYYTEEEVIDLCERGIYDLVELIKTGGTHDAGGNLELLQPGIATGIPEQTFGEKVRARLRAVFAFQKAGKLHALKVNAPKRCAQPPGEVRKL